MTPNVFHQDARPSVPLHICPSIPDSRTLWPLHLRILAHWYSVARPFKAYHLESPSLKVTVTETEGKIWRNKTLTLAEILWPLQSWHFSHRNSVANAFRPLSSVVFFCLFVFCFVFCFGLRSQGLMENIESLKHWHFLRHYHYSHESWHSNSLW